MYPLQLDCIDDNTLQDIAVYVVMEQITHLYSLARPTGTCLQPAAHHPANLLSQGHQ